MDTSTGSVYKAFDYSRFLPTMVLICISLNNTDDVFDLLTVYNPFHNNFIMHQAKHYEKVLISNMYCQ